MAYELEDELEALPELEDELEEELEDEGELEDELEDEAGLEGEGWLGAIGNIAGSLLGEEEGEDEFEGEDEYEDEDEISPVRKIYPDAMMEHLGELAAEAESEDEAAEQFLPLVGMAASKLLPVVARAVAPMAKRALPRIAHAVNRSVPHLTRGIGKVARVLHRNPQTRHLLKVVPAIARRTVGSVAHHAARGRRVTPGHAVRTLARHARRVLAHPHHRAHALRHHRHLERRFHHLHGPRHHHLRYGWRGYGPRYRGIRRRGLRGYGLGRRIRGGVGRPRLVRTAGGGLVRVPGARVRRGRVVGGQCKCAPAYCRCCGQLLR
jgi:hypothetical protein